MFGLKPLRFEVIATALVPDPDDWEVVELKVARVLLVPHSNHDVVDAPFGFTVPLTVAPLEVTELAAVVVTTGNSGIVVKLQVADQLLVPPLFFAFALQ